MKEERARLEALDRILRRNIVRKQISPVILRVGAALAEKPEAVMRWEPLPLAIFGGELPEKIRSSWVFVLRAGADTGPERHPNSHQRMMSVEGSGDMQIAISSSDVKLLNDSDVKSEADIQWRSNLLISEPAAPLERRWISIPVNVWHRPVTGPEANWVVVSFHTVTAEELIEERPSASTLTGTKRMKYFEAPGV